MAILGEMHMCDVSYNQSLSVAKYGEIVSRVQTVCQASTDPSWLGIWQYNQLANVGFPTLAEDGLMFTGGNNALAGVNGSGSSVVSFGIWVKITTVSGSYGIIQFDFGSTRRGAIWQVNNQFYFVTNNWVYSSDPYLAVNTWYYCVVGVTTVSIDVNGSPMSGALVSTGTVGYSGTWLGRCVSTNSGTINGNCIIGDVYLQSTYDAAVKQRTYKQQNYPIDLLAQPMNLRQSESRQFMQNSRGT